MSDRPTLAKLFAIAVVVAWFFAVTFNYYVVHKPFAVENAFALVSVAGDVFAFALLFLLACASGRRLARGFELQSPLESIVLRAGLGWGAISFSILLLGILGLLSALIFWIILLLALIALRNDVRSSVRELRASRFPIGSRFERALALFIAATLLMALLRALTPTLAWDAQVYHLTEGKFWIAQGRITAPPDIPYFSFPSLVENLYLGALLLKGDTLAQVIHWGFLLLTVGLVFQFAHKIFSTRMGWMAAALLSAVPSLVLIASWPYVDAALAFYATAGLYVVLRATLCEGTTDGRGLVLAGVFAGLALGVKYTALIIPLALAVLILARGLNRESIKQLARFGAPTALFAAPWYLRNLVAQGNPIYPFLFGGKFWDAFRAAQFGRFGTGLLGEPLRLVLAPWEASISGQEGALNYEATIGPLLLLSVPLVLLARTRRNWHVRALLVFVSVPYLFWLFGVAGSKLLEQTRLLFPAFPALALAAAVGLDALQEFDLPQFSLARFARLVTALVLGLTLLAQTLDLFELNPFPFLAGYESRDMYLTRRLAPAGYYPAMQSLASLKPTDKVLFLWEPRSFYARGAAQLAPDALLDHFGDLRFRYRDAASIIAALRAEGYTHILLNRAGLNYYLTTQYDPVSREDALALQTLLSQNFRQVYGRAAFELASDGSVVNADSDAYALYEILPLGSASQ